MTSCKQMLRDLGCVIFLYNCYKQRYTFKLKRQTNFLMLQKHYNFSPHEILVRNPVVENV